MRHKPRRAPFTRTRRTSMIRKTGTWFASATLAVVVLAPGVASAQEPEVASVRSGFTIELGLGAGLSMIQPDAEGVDSENKFGVSGLALGLGGFLNDKVAIMGRIAGT